MEILYTALLLLIYIALVAAGVSVYVWSEKRKGAAAPLALPVLGETESRAALNEMLAPTGFSYDGEQNIFYSRMDSWQRKYGYGRLYDEAAPLLNMVIDCEPIYFDYDGKKWLIEFWKGQYGITVGAEVGIYYLPKQEAEEAGIFSQLIYKAVEDEDCLRIKTLLSGNGQQIFFRQGYHWWLTGFSLGEYAKPKDLQLDVEITLKNKMMRDAFLQGLYRAGYRNGELNMLGNTIWIRFLKPHTRQPLTRTRAFCALKQWENKRNCKWFARITTDCNDAYEKLMALKLRAPKLYKQWERLSTGRVGQKGDRDARL
ncbi:hypothetical protein FACS1894111_01850 [Clostridia bacterium]|nr:hypothetical protein FACS1894111_01850 [Clostridia bacterium]